MEGSVHSPQLLLKVFAHSIFLTIFIPLLNHPQFNQNTFKTHQTTSNNQIYRNGYRQVCHLAIPSPCYHILTLAQERRQLRR